MTVPLFKNSIEQLPYVTDHRHEPVIMDITPSLANSWLNRIPETQRSVRDTAVEQYKKDMLSGNWNIDYSPFRFSKTGRLIDGQHRCFAIVEANVVLPSQAVVFGMDDTDYEGLDQGVKRTFSDTLKYYGFPNTLNMSAICYRQYYWDRSKTFRKYGERPTQTELLRIARANSEEFLASLRVGSRVSNHVPPIISGVAAMVHRLCYQVDDSEGKRDTEFFFDRLIDGQNLLDGDALYALRNRWAVNAAKKRDKPEDYIQGAIMIKAWNYYRSGEQVQNLVWRSGGDSPEPFPQPK